MLISIVPTITTDDPVKYKQAVDKFHPFSNRAQADISDSKFAPNPTIPASAVWWPKGWTMDIHAMVEKPSETIPDMLKLRPNLVIYHAEVEEDLLPIFEQLKAADIKVGVAIQKQTFPGNIKPLIQAADHAMIFSGILGKQGGTANLLQLEKVHILRSIKKDLEISWDGGANLNNIRTIAQAGVNVVYVGQAISSVTDPQAAHAALLAEAEKTGVVL